LIPVKQSEAGGVVVDSRRAARETLSATFAVDASGGFDPYNHR
jgi:hypothetical protein